MNGNCPVTRIPIGYPRRNLHVSIYLIRFFIATSNGTLNSLDNHNGGRCKTNNMRLAVTVCGANENCVQHNNLCKTPKASPKPVVVTMTTTTTTERAKPTEMKTRTTEDGIVIEPKAAPKQNDQGELGHNLK